MAIEAENFETEFFKCQSNELSEQETPMKTEMKSNCDVKGDSENEGHWNCSLFVDRTSENASKGEKIEKLEMTSLTCDKTNEMMPLTCEKSTLVSDNRSLTSENTLLTHVLPVKVDTSVDSTTDLRISNHSCEMRKPPSVDVQNSLKKLEVKSRSGDGLRPVARLIHDLGLDLVRQQVYNDLIKIQEAKDVKHKLNEKEREQLKRLTDSHSKLLIKNANYRLPTIRCRCFFVSTSANVVELHREFGSTAELSFYTCCLCDVFKTHYLSQFQAHLESVHSKKGRIFAKLASHVCKFCPYEHRNQMRMEAHVAKCFKRFSLNANMQPSPADCDIPLMGKVSPMASHQKRPTAALINSKGSRLIQFSKQTHPSVSFSLSAQQQTVMEIKGRLYGLEQQNGKVILTSQQSPSNSSASTARSFSRSLAQFPFPSGKPLSSEKLLPGQHLEKCEMCDTVVNNREMLWNHFCSVHRLEINKESMIDKDPSMACDVCSAKFFTFYGLTRHSVAVHRRELKTLNKSFKCFLCCQVQLNPLNHLSTCHNITVLDMYQSRRCCMCNRKLRTARAFEEHMVLQHHDIFANKDVLCTVLQALSAALFLKNENVSHARLDRLVPANMKNIIETTSNKNATINKIGTAGIIRKQIRIDEKDALHSISISQTPQVKPGRLSLIHI